ncbi:molecular chaperone GrpE [Natranaerovirga hydrolytica]|uniref:Protein GrpE n=1 Tax=Natranaerovirga hydrolytica TaxID=680378 RepID=A0A4V2Q1P1_9FIRM|nr:nucleotide exchange factor GrpE [Natranaerovirga hydrolytica]TCK98401.1 molecular chaperone GrpE [Natranaerovirga hydrolytica]
MDKNKEEDIIIEENLDNTQDETVAKEEIQEEAEVKKDKKKDKKKKKDDKDEKLDEYVDRLKRTMAEFDNYRKRTEKEKSQMYDKGKKDVLEQILPLIDNFERALSGNSNEDGEKDTFLQGVEMIYKQFLEMLEGYDIKVIDALEQEFDPKYHNAVMHIEDDQYGDNIIIEEFQKGYMYKEEVLRHSMVKVAN